MFSIMRDAFERYGFQPIETPAMESLSTLTGKYGDEGDQLIFKLLNNGDFLAKADSEALEKKDSKGLLSSISKKALRYDLTVPFARFVVMARNDLAFPFRRYQMQNVWRGDRPGKGRYQEFTQCDADIIGSDSILCELDLMLLFHEVLDKLGVPGYQIMLNDRRLLNGLARSWGIEDQFSELTVALDKWDKIGDNGVRKELGERGMHEDQISQVMGLFSLLASDDSMVRLDGVQRLLLPDDDEAQTAYREVVKLLQSAKDSGVPASCISFDPTLARGLNYYTGAIFEVRVKDAPVGSICGGGRYADLTGIFGWEGMSGVGISFGADRIYDVLEHFQSFPAASSTGPQALVLMLDEESEVGAIQMTAALRKSGIRASAYPQVAKLKKQMKYAADLNVKFVIMAGEEERSLNEWTIRQMDSGVQQRFSLDDAIAFLATAL
jgi:histidyl-tRNA synthetase